MLSKKWCNWTSMAGVIALFPATMAMAQDSTTIPAGVPQVLEYTPNNGLGIQAATPVIRVYKDFNAWWNENRDEATLSSLGKTKGTDWFVHPVSDCQNGIPAGTSVVLFTSNSYGQSSTTAAQNDPACQESLNNFLKGGGVLIVDKGDNDYSGGFIAPGANGTPELVFPDSCTDATLTPAATGPDNVIGTADDHPIVNASVYWNNDNIDGQDSCYHNHGNLAQGMTLPNGSTTLMTASYQGIEQPILAEYCHNGGRVILDTLTKEFIGQTPSGNGPSNFLLNLFSYALSPASACIIPVTIDIKHGSNQNSINLCSKGAVPVAIMGYDTFDVNNINPSSLTLAGATVKAVKYRILCGTEDVNADGYADLVCHFNTTELDLDQTSTSATVKGKTVDGTPIEGSDSVVIVKDGCL